MELEGKSVLITGGTGTFGRAFVELLLDEVAPREVVIFSRDELKQSEMRQGRLADAPMRYVVGDVRDAAGLRRAMVGVDVVVHAAALKQVPTCEAQPVEPVLTNVLGAQNVIDAANDRGVSRVITLSTDKAVHPENVYGATKLLAERMFLRADETGAETRFAVVRYGNVLGSRGSVITRFAAQRAGGLVELTDDRMTRFWIRIEDAARFVLRCLTSMEGGEIFVPKLPSSSVAALARVVAPRASVRVIGARPGEKLHEVLLSDREHGVAEEHDDMYVVHSGRAETDAAPFRYASDATESAIDDEALAALVSDFIE